MLTGESSVDEWLSGLDPRVSGDDGSGRGARDWNDVPHHRYALWQEGQRDTGKTPTNETHHNTDDAKIGTMVVRNTVTGELRTLDEVWADAKNARYTATESGSVVAVEAEFAPSPTPLEKAVGRIVIAPQISIAPWAAGEALPLSQAA